MEPANVPGRRAWFSGMAVHVWRALQIVAVLGLVASLAIALMAQQVRPEPRNVYATVERLTVEGMQRVRDANATDPEMVNHIDTMLQIFDSWQEDLALYRRHAYVACAALAGQSLVVLALVQHAQRTASAGKQEDTHGSRETQS